MLRSAGGSVWKRRTLFQSCPMLMIGTPSGATRAAAVVRSYALLLGDRPLAAEEPDHPIPEHLDGQRDGRRHAEHRRDEHAARSRIEIGVGRRGDRQTGHQDERNAKDHTYLES